MTPAREGRAIHTGDKFNLQIRTATPEDGPAVTALVLALAREREGPLPPEEVVRASVEACAGERSLLLIAEEAGEVLGYLAVHWIPFPLLAGWEGYISDLVIAESRRGRGVGTALLDAATEHAQARGCVRLSLNNRITSHAFTRGFFTKAGFRQRTEFANFVKALC